MMIVVCGLLIVTPLFFISQLAFAVFGLDQLNAFGADGANVLQNTPTVSLVAPFLRAPLLILTLLFLVRRSRWASISFALATLIHLVSWMSILSNAYFTLPTGYLTLALEAGGIYLLVRYPELRAPTVNGKTSGA
ncbi:hypothetical protein [Maricaulis maris]|uniref:hypothetical protein n=1 Tax=Maricaulis maris TaxID=74318 RepID=UPI00167FDDA4|nr:hypothetical protein [Maricaulis maris]